MSTVGQRERATQNRVVQLFQTHLGYRYLGNWESRPNNRNIEADLLRSWLSRQGVSETLIDKALRELDQAAALGDSQNLYDANKAVYGLLRYGVKVKAGAGEQTQTVPLIDWQQPENNDFAIAEEVALKGQNTRRPDIVLYVNGIALGMLELKKGSVDVAKGIHQSLDNQRMVWLANWLRENAPDVRVLIITNRTELDEQIEGVFKGVDEGIYRTASGTDLIAQLNVTTPWLLCSLVHKFGSRDEADTSQSTEQFIQDLQRHLPSNFSLKGNLFQLSSQYKRTKLPQIAALPL